MKTFLLIIVAGHLAWAGRVQRFPLAIEPQFVNTGTETIVTTCTITNPQPISQDISVTVLSDSTYTTDVVHNLAEGIPTTFVLSGNQSYTVRYYAQHGVSGGIYPSMIKIAATQNTGSLIANCVQYYCNGTFCMSHTVAVNGGRPF